jgi:hypothetical protein
MTLKEILQGTAFALGGYRWWAAFKHKWDELLPAAASSATLQPQQVAADFQALGRKF